jgi:tetratricopeptide (TPR) repeat protein
MKLRVPATRLGLPLLVGAIVACAPAADDDGANGAAIDPNAEVTFNRDVAPLVFEHCTPCHRPGGGAPIEFLDYASVRKRARQIVRVIGTGYMPPWLPEPGHGEFEGERRLSEEQTALLRTWVSRGMPEGDPADLPGPPAFPDEWHLGEPDLVLTLAEPFMLPAEGRDVYRNFVLPTSLTGSRFVRTLEFKPSDPALVHHARFAVDPSPLSRQADQADPLPGYEGMDLGSAINPDGHLLGWAPGRYPHEGSDAMSWELRPGMDVIAQLHMIPSGKPEPVNMRLGLYFASGPPTLRPYTIVMGSRDIDIPPGEPRYEVVDRFTLPVDVEVTALLPHAHYIGKEMHAIATLPDGEERWLLRIDDWDFNWQDEYRYVEPVALPAGSTITMRYTFDNTYDNPRNPFVPPRRITYGPQTTDEMAELAVQVVPRDPNDFERLVASYNEQHVGKAVEYRLRQLERDPNDADSHAAVGSSYIELGRFDRAAVHLARAVELRPGDARSHNNLGWVLQRLGRTEEALAAYRRAVQLDPGSADLQHNLARALRGQGRWTEALPHLREAVRLQPDIPVSLADLAWVLATHPDAEARDPEQASRIARRAVELTGGRDPGVLAALAAAHGSAGRFDEAVRAAGRALEIAANAGADSLSANLRAQLERYRNRSPYLSEGVR